MGTRIEFWVVTGALLLVGWSEAFAADLLPAAKYAEIPEASVIRMSPDGHKFAMTESIAGKQVLAIQDVDGTKALADLGEFQLRWAAWKSNTRLLIGMFGSTDHFFTQGNFYQTGVERMLAMDADRTHVLDIGDVPTHPQLEDILTSLRESDPHHVLQTLNPIPPTIDQPTATGVWRIDVDSGAREKIVAPVKTATSFLADSDGIVRLMVTQSGADRNTAAARRAWLEALDRFLAANLAPA